VALLGCVARRNLYLDRGNYYLFLNHYVLLVGPSGVRKSQAVLTLLDLAHALNQCVNERALEQGQGAATSASIYLAPQRTTPEFLLEDLARQRSLDPKALLAGHALVRQPDAVALIACDELVGLLGATQGGARRLVQFLTEAYATHETFRSGTISRGERVLSNLAVSTPFATTEEWLRTAMTPDVFQGGFMARQVVAARESDRGSYPRAENLDPAARLWLAETLAPWAELRNPVELELTQRAESWFGDWYHQRKNELLSNPNLAPYRKRRHDHLLKLAAVLAFSERITPQADLRPVDDALPIEPRHLVQSHEILHREEMRFPALFRHLGTGPDDALRNRIYEMIVHLYRREEEPPWHDELYHRVRGRVGSRERFVVLLEGLIAAKRVRRIRRGAGTMHGTQYEPLFPTPEVGN
jgi:hypothetical protein